MTPTRTRRRGVRLVLATAVLLSAGLGLAGCGGEEQSPGEAVPALQAYLGDVDRAVQQGDTPALRRALDQLADEATRARESGDLDDGDASRILEAVTALRAELPTGDGGASTPEPSDPTSESPTTEPEPVPPPHDAGEDEGSEDEGGEDEGGEDEGGEDEESEEERKKDEEREKEKEKDEKKDD